MSPRVQANNSLFPRYLFLYSIKLSFKLKAVILPSLLQAHWWHSCILIQSSLQPSLVLKQQTWPFTYPASRKEACSHLAHHKNQSQGELNALLEGRESSGMKSRHHILCPLSAAQSSAAPIPFKAPCSLQADGKKLQGTRVCLLLLNSPLLALLPRTSAEGSSSSAMN